MAESRNAQTNITVQAPLAHGWQVLGTVMICGALGMASWALAKAGWLELAATALTMFIVTLARMLLAAGLWRAPEARHFKSTAGLVGTMREDYAKWQAESPIIRLALLAVGYTVAFLIFRAAVTTMLHVFSNPWLAGAAGLLAGSFVVSPVLWASVRDWMRSRTDSTSTPAATSAPAEDEVARLARLAAEGRASGHEVNVPNTTTYESPIPPPPYPAPRVVRDYDEREAL